MLWSCPAQLHYGDTVSSVPLWYSERWADRLEAAGAPNEFYVCLGNNHSLTESTTTAMARSLAFFDEHVRGTE